MAFGKKKAYDPVEDAKGGAVQPAAPASSEAPTAPIMPAFEAKPTPTAAAVAPVRKRYRIKASKQVIVGGCITHVHAGDVITETGHGKETIAKLVTQGVELEELK